MRVILVVALVAGLLVGSGDPAQAKGPESGTLTGPGIEEPVELVAVDSFPVEWTLVARLMEQTGVWYGTGDLPTPLDAKPDGELGPAYTLTWVNDHRAGGSVAERTIRQLIYLDAAAGPVIHTEQVPKGWGPGVLGWFVAPGGLRDTLIELGAPVAADDGPRTPDRLWYLAAAAELAVLLAMTWVAHRPHAAWQR